MVNNILQLIIKKDELKQENNKILNLDSQMKSLSHLEQLDGK